MDFKEGDSRTAREGNNFRVIAITVEAQRETRGIRGRKRSRGHVGEKKKRCDQQQWDYQRELFCIQLGQNHAKLQCH